MTESPRYGATPEEWINLELGLGIGQDLLPVVANPNAVISPNSKMKDKGKTPSKYNKDRQVAGITGWTQYKATPEDIAKWEKEPDYGICIQTRLVRALDIDVPDRALARTIVEAIYKEMSFPIRIRNNTGKCLLAFRLPGEFGKRVLKVEGGIIEFLANGQQFVACGTHSSGARLEWDWVGHDNFPTLTVDEFERIWAMLVEQFAIEKPADAGALRKRGEHLALHDPILEKLDVLDWGNDGQAYITCPWKDNHSMDSGITETAYFPKGTNGYEQGHFKCMHAGCAHRDDMEFMDAFGLRLAAFDIIPEDVGPDAKKPFPKFERDKHGAIEATLTNIVAALEHGDMLRARVRFDEFRSDAMFLDMLEDSVWRPMREADPVKLRMRLEQQGFKPVGRELMRDAINEMCDRERYDSAIEWIEGLPAWDGTKRVAAFMAHYFGAKDDAYATAVSHYMWTAMAGRVLVPGIKADMAPILVSPQGRMKSSAIAALAPNEELFVELNLSDDDDKLARMMKGCLVAELSELRGLQTRDAELIKAFVVRRIEKWVPKYMERAITYPRRLLMIGTTNQREFLADETGHRRWLPIQIAQADIDAIIRDRDQLWAEAKVLFEKNGIMWQDAQGLAENEHGQYLISDSWEEPVADWFEREKDDISGPRDFSFVTIADVLRGAIGISPDRATKSDETRIRKILQVRGYEPAKKYIFGVQKRGWSLKQDRQDSARQ